MEVRIFANKDDLGKAAARCAGAHLRSLLKAEREATLIAATGASQFEFLDHLVQEPEIAWSRVVFFHLDEYLGLPESHPAGFRDYLRQRIERRIRPGRFHYINGNHPDPSEECRRLGDLIRNRVVDIAFLGIGENGHIAFNDPPADFETQDAFRVVELDDKCRRQQLGEGWFECLAEVPRRAISMSVSQVLKSHKILCVVPDRRKAEAVRNCLEAEIEPAVPCSILRRHPDVTLFLDVESALLVSSRVRDRAFFLEGDES